MCLHGFVCMGMHMYAYVFVKVCVCSGMYMHRHMCVCILSHTSHHVKWPGADSYTPSPPGSQSRGGIWAREAGGLGPSPGCPRYLWGSRGDVHSQAFLPMDICVHTGSGTQRGRTDQDPLPPPQYLIPSGSRAPQFHLLHHTSTNSTPMHVVHVHVWAHRCMCMCVYMPALHRCALLVYICSEFRMYFKINHG